MPSYLSHIVLIRVQRSSSIDTDEKWVSKDIGRVRLRLFGVQLQLWGWKYFNFLTETSFSYPSN